MGELNTPEGSGMHHGTYSFTVAHGEIFWPYTYNGITTFRSGHGAGLSGSGFAQRREDGKIVIRGVLRHAGVTDPNLQHLLQGLVIVEGIGDAVEHTLIGEGFEWL